MNETTRQAHPRSHAHAIGVVYLSYFATAILGLFLSSRKLPAGVSMMAWPADALYATLAILLYRLFQTAQPLLALVATLCSLAGCVTDGLHHCNFHDWYFEAKSPLLFFGPFCVLLGLLILRSRFLPPWLGWPLIVAGLGWLAYLIQRMV